MRDPYLDAKGVLKNKLGFTDQNELAAFEARIAAARDVKILGDPPHGPFDLAKLEKLHEMLFGDVYTWAGKTRIAGLAKQAHEGSAAGVTSFTAPLRIKAEATALFRSLPSIETLSALSDAEFAASMAPFFVTLNNVHPFREGNGRTQRLFFKLLARACGNDLAWDVVTRERVVAASISGARGDAAPMKRLFLEISDDRRTAALRKGLNFLRGSKSVLWNDLYIATTTAGQAYSGKLVGVAAPDFMMRVENSEQEWIAVGDASDVPDGTASGDALEIKPKYW
ncbi:Fic family protein [Mesorhizobium sp. VK24D]|uniref:protein adenylyltransferase n=1 Tax=Mesorhizobium album TaxID=3072314 RepID=A0ABU4XW22_9HYPH|nr:Fic family protein [Mesorhizobium sp. VK24D]MDX8478900.1 Fic family protein [Mesorhizobium sp. VK24D]